MNDPLTESTVINPRVWDFFSYDILVIIVKLRS